MLADYITRITADGSVFIAPKKEFSDDEFSDNEMKLLEHIVETFQASSAADLIQLTHRKHSLWYITAQENGVLEHLETGHLNSTEIPIDFSRLLESMPLKKEIYQDQLSYLRNTKSLKI